MAQQIEMEAVKKATGVERGRLERAYLYSNLLKINLHYDKFH